MQRTPGLKQVAVWLLTLALAALLAAPARAAPADAALFQGILAPYGSWIEYGNQGPVWYPTRVSSFWHPYLDGRWVPTKAGWVFETPEPWGWATYHYGNWLLTPEYGWVWAPGSTWYPATVAWRTSNAYIGWAPIPPASFLASLSLTPGFRARPENAGLDLLPASWWIFARSANFLLGFGRPFLPGYSYYNCGCLTPLGSVPIILPTTALVRNFVSPAFAPRAFFSFGPRFSRVAFITNTKVAQINRFTRGLNITRLKNVVPPQGLLARHPVLQRAFPSMVLQGRTFPLVAAGGIGLPTRLLNRPGIVPAPASLHRVPRELPQVLVTSRRPGKLTSRAPAGLEHLILPPQAVLKTPRFRRKLRRQGLLRLKPGQALTTNLKVKPEDQVLLLRRGPVRRLSPVEENLKRQAEINLLVPRRRHFIGPQRFPLHQVRPLGTISSHH